MDELIVTRRLPHALIRPRVGATLRRSLWLLLIFFLMAALIPSEGYLGAAYPELVINRAIGSHGFKLVAWELSAWQQKLADAINQPGTGLTPAAQHDLVVSYFAAINRIGELNRSIQRLYADPRQTNPKAAAAPLEAELDQLRGQQSSRRPAVERILQNQVSDTLAANGLFVAHSVWPPVLFRFSESPDVLIVSPRNRIVLQHSAFVQPGASMGQMERMEGQVEQGLSESALVEGTGGFSAYPTMVVEYADLPWVLSTIAHEWFHTHLAFYPLGWHYFDNGDTRTLNETAASLFGDELGDQVLRRYYPELAPAPAAASKPLGQAAAPAGKPAGFSFSDTMRSTRLKVDQLLREGKIAEAESYMEAQRRLIVSHGYMLRKLNQAYFAFHGSYAVGPAATDPIGEKLRALRDRSPSLAAFVRAVRGVTSVGQLDGLLAQN